MDYSWLYEQEFHELMMDYRGAVSPHDAHAAFEAVQEYIRKQVDPYGRGIIKQSTEF